MERIQLIIELARTQADLLERYSQMAAAKQQFATRLQQLQEHIDPRIPTELGPPRDALTDLPRRLRNSDLEVEAKRISDALSRIILHLSTTQDAE